MKWIFGLLFLIAGAAVYDFISDKAEQSDAQRLAEIDDQIAILDVEHCKHPDVVHRDEAGFKIMALEDERQEILLRHPGWIGQISVKQASPHVH